jgi:hypothetical protein
MNIPHDTAWGQRQPPSRSTVDKKTCTGDCITWWRIDIVRNSILLYNIIYYSIIYFIKSIEESVNNKIQ